MSSSFRASSSVRSLRDRRSALSSAITSGSLVVVFFDVVTVSRGCGEAGVGQVVGDAAVDDLEGALELGGALGRSTANSGGMTRSPSFV